MGYSSALSPWMPRLLVRTAPGGSQSSGMIPTALHWKGDPQRRQRIQMVLLRESGMTQPAIAGAMGMSLSTVNRVHMAYDGGGLKALKSKPNGGRKRENMTLAEEKALLARFAKAAGAGEMLNIHDLKAAYEKAIGHPTSNSTVYNLLDRHDWRKLMPRPFHPDRDIQAQIDFALYRFRFSHLPESYSMGRERSPREKGPSVSRAALVTYGVHR
jgi:transposase